MKVLANIVCTAFWLIVWPFMVFKVLLIGAASVSLHVGVEILKLWGEQ